MGGVWFGLDDAYIHHHHTYKLIFLMGSGAFFTFLKFMFLSDYAGWNGTIGQIGRYCAFCIGNRRLDQIRF